MKTCTWLKDCQQTKRDMGSFVWKVFMLILITWEFGFPCSEDCIIGNKVPQKMGINQFKLFNFKTCAWLEFWKLGVCHSMCQFKGQLNAIVAKHYMMNNFWYWNLLCNSLERNLKLLKIPKACKVQSEKAWRSWFSISWKVKSSP
jgi:hypothetical protein